MILDTIQRRCTLYKLRDLEEEDINTLVETLLQRVQSELPADRLSMILAEKGVKSPGLIAQAVEKYVIGAPPEEAADVEASTAIDVRALTKAITHGDWPAASKYLEDAQQADAQSIRLSSVAYMRQMLLHSPEIADRAKAIAQAIDELVSVQRAEASVVSAALTAAVYRATSFFYKYR
jgi:DNA polymerase III delta prime subunit